MGPRAGLRRLVLGGRAAPLPVAEDPRLTGPEPGDGSVVDPSTFAVYGLESLFVADASVMPQVTTGNTNAPSVMIGERASAALLGPTPSR